MAALAEWVIGQEQLPSGAILLQPYQDVLGVLNEWETNLATETTYNDDQLKNKLALYKAQVYVLAGERTQAISEFANLTTWGDSIYVEDANYWICHLQHQELLSQNIGDVSFLESLPGCTYTMQSSLLLKRGALESVDDLVATDLMKYRVYPNPSKGGLTVSLTSNKEHKLEIELIDIYGKKVKDFGAYNTQKGVFKIKLATDELRVGTYFIKLSTGNEVSYEKVMLLD